MTVDVSQDLAPDNKKLQTISSVAQSMLEVDAKILELESQLQQLKEEKYSLETVVMPDLLLSAGVESFKMTSGAVVSLEEGMSLSVPKKNMAQICGWLRSHKHDDIIKHEIVVPVPKGKDSNKQVNEIKMFLKSKKVEFSTEENVHSGTLKALLKEQRAKGVEINLSLFGAWEWKKAEITLPK